MGHGHDDGHGRGNAHAGGHTHTHTHTHIRLTADSDGRLIRLALGLIVAFMVAEIIVAIAAGSVALAADAAHLLADAAALAGSLGALRLAARPAGGSMTFGWTRAEILSAAASGATMAVAAVAITVESVRRLIDPGPVAGSAVLVVALVGVAVNLAATRALAGANRGSLNVEGAYQHVLTDLFAFIATAIAGTLILTTGFRRADPIAGLVVVVLLVRAAYGLLRDSGRILLEAAPRGVDLAAVRAELMAADHVSDVHDLHVWTLATELPSVSAHVVVEDSCFTDGHAPQILDSLQAAIAGRYDVAHSTFQLEPAGHVDHELGSHA